MALEDLTGTKYLDSLVATNPALGDQLQYQDDHTRGIKNVLLNTFPNLTGAVTATQGRLNDVPLPNSVRLMFHEAAVPTGWTLVTGVDDRIPLFTDTAAQGRTNGGSWTISGNTGSGTTGSDGAHDHAFSDSGTTGAASALAFANPGAGSAVAGAHNHTFSVSGTTSSGGGHTHNMPALSISISSFRGLYTKFIICSKDVVT